MLQITLTQRNHPGTHIPSMPQKDLYEAGRKAWVLGYGADRERYALIVFDNTVLQAIDIDRLVDVEVTSGSGKPQKRREIEGTILSKGHKVYDMFVGKPAPAASTQNPIKYVETKFDLTPCRCGCGEEVRADFLPGHDQRAIHEVVGRFGSVVKFLDWFETAYEPARR